MPKQSRSNTHIFSVRHITVFLHLGTLKTPSSLHLQAFLNDKITNTKPKNVKNMALKRILVDNMKAGTRRQNVANSAGMSDLGNRNISLLCTKHPNDH